MSTENSKPEWFQMAEADGFDPKPTSKKVIRIMALATPLFVLSAGLAFAQTQGSPSAVATSVTTPALATPASAPVGAQISQAASTTQNASITIKKPGITMPTGGGEND